jgi:hypothetical protein
MNPADPRIELLLEFVRLNSYQRAAFKTGLNESSIRNIAKGRRQGTPETWEKLSVLWRDPKPAAKETNESTKDPTPAAHSNPLHASLYEVNIAIRLAERPIDQAALLREKSSIAKALSKTRPRLISEGNSVENMLALAREVFSARRGPHHSDALIDGALAVLRHVIKDTFAEEAIEQASLGPDPWDIFSEVQETAEAILASKEELGSTARCRLLSVKRAAIVALERLDDEQLWRKATNDRWEAFHARYEAKLSERKAENAA